MLGAGVGFDVRGTGQIHITGPDNTLDPFIYTVPDTREGWSYGMELLFNSYVNEDGAQPVDFDYSLIRKAGMPIKGFGGISCGPDPLKNLYESAKKILDKNIGSPITTRTIADLFNIIGVAVVSGNIRRSSEIALGYPDDKEFENLKNYDLNPERAAIGWSSNNSVFATIGQDYTSQIEGMYKNGEPGLVWLENINNYARMNGTKDTDDPAILLNPCLTGETLIAAADGRGNVRIDEIEDGTPVYCSDDNGNLAIRPMRHPRITGYNKPVFKVTLDDGMTIRATSNHKFLTRNNGYVELSSLKPGDSVTFMSRYIPDQRSESRGDQYITLGWLGSPVHAEHAEIAKYHHGLDDLSGFHVHHIDGIKTNNNPENLSVIDSTEHLSAHSKGMNNANSKNVNNDELLQYGIKLCKTLQRRFSHDEWVSYAEKNNLPKSFSNYRTRFLGNISSFSKTCAIISGYDSMINLDPRTARTYQKSVASGYNTTIVNGKVMVTKQCENCGKQLVVPYNKRETGFCSTLCYNQKRDYRKNVAGQKIAFHNKKKRNKKEQTRVLLDMKFNDGSWPMKKQWVEECGKQGVVSSMGRTSSPFQKYGELKQYAENYNHKIVSIEPDGHEDVWNGTVDDYHNFFVGGHESKTLAGRTRMCYLNNTQCGEVSLLSREFCNLIELYPFRNDDLYDYARSIKFAYLYGKAVTLLSNKIRDNQSRSTMMRNRRIGLSNTGIAQFIGAYGTTKLVEWLEYGYSEVERYDKVYSHWLGVNKSNRKTTSKPSGSVSLLSGSTPGVHYPHSEYYIRRIRIAENSDLVTTIAAHGYKIEQDAVSPGTVVVEFPIHVGENARSENDVTIWEQLATAALIQKHWSDNSVSVTVKFNPEKTSKEELASAIDFYQHELKTVSFLPQVKDGAYKQMPYEEITKEEYEEAMANITPMTLLRSEHDFDLEDKYCSNDSCEIDFSKEQ